MCFARHEIAHHCANGEWLTHSFVKKDIIARAEFWGRMFYAILRSGNVKPLYFVTPDASDFINRTFIADEVEDGFYGENFSNPLIMYADNPKTLFDDVCGVLICYNVEDDSLDCEIALADQNGKSGMLGRVFEIDEMDGVLKRQVLAVDANNKNEFLSFSFGGVDTLDDVNRRFYNALLYAFKFVRLRRCDKTPVLVEPRYKVRKAGNSECGNRNTLVHQQVSLTESYRHALRRQKDGEVVALDKEDKELKAVRVCGFVRKQHYGKGNALIKDVYIEAHESHAWKKTGLRIIKVIK